ncbi:PHP domain-containing protein [bacterium]|nr:PHP domain-containing protein [candidate division CSSED10-310 bacterium]
MKLKEFKADLHIHTCLSPCSDLTMSPGNIVSAALEKGLDIIAVTDHNSGENADPVMQIAHDTPLIVIPGMEVTSREEVHVLAFFRSIEFLGFFQKEIYSHLIRDPSNPYRDDQIIANALDEVEGFCDYLLIGSTDLSLRQIVRLIGQNEGLAVAAHIDRQAFGIIGQLGFIPANIPFDALEVSYRTPIGTVDEVYPQYADYTFITDSDAHNLEEIGRVFNRFHMNRPDFDNLRLAFHRREGCHVGAETDS